MPAPPLLADDPINTAEEDSYGIAGFATAIARSLLQHRRKSGTVVALNGPWGSGKTSIVNLIKEQIEKAQVMDDRVQAQRIAVTDFKCWWFRGEEALALAFLQHLGGMLRDGMGDRAKTLVTKLSKALLQTSTTLSSAFAAATKNPLFAIGNAAGLAEKWLFPDETLDSVFDALSAMLEKTDRRFIVIIDDIDRLSPDEALAIFRLVKSVGHLPNVTYLLVYDRELAERAVETRYPSEGPHFLEKIIQASFDVPAPNQTDLNAAILKHAADVIGDIPDDQTTYFGNVFVDAVSPYVTTPRHVARLAGAISVTWPAVAKNVNAADYLAMEAMRLYEPRLFNAVKERRDLVTGVRRDRDEDRGEGRFLPYVAGVPEPRRERAKVALQRLFPRLETMGYDNSFLAGWDRERRVCVSKHLETYLRSTLAEETLPGDAMNGLLAHAANADFVRRTFRDAARRRRRNGGSFVPVYLDELRLHADRLAAADIGPFLATLFEMHDEINLPEDAKKGFMTRADTSLRYHWLIRHLTKRFSLDEKTDLYLRALAAAPLDWGVDFAVSAIRQYDREAEGSPPSDDDRLVRQDALKPCSDRALTLLRSAGADGTLLLSRRLLSHLYCWRRLNDNDATEVRQWTDGVLDDDAATLVLMRALTSTAYSAGLGFTGMGDRVATAVMQVQIPRDIDIVDATHLRRNLERMLDDPDTETSTRAEIRKFMNTWDGKGDDLV